MKEVSDEGGEIAVICQMKIEEQNHDNRTGYDMLLAKMEMNFHMSGVGHKNPLDGDYILCDSCSTTCIFGKVESISYETLERWKKKLR